MQALAGACLAGLPRHHRRHPDLVWHKAFAKAPDYRRRGRVEPAGGTSSLNETYEDWRVAVRPTKRGGVRHPRKWSAFVHGVRAESQRFAHSPTGLITGLNARGAVVA
jgi:hypothetical protein